MNMKSRINKLARQIEGDPNGECKCPGVQTTFAVTYKGDPAPPQPEICSSCGRKVPMHVVMIVYDNELDQASP